MKICRVLQADITFWLCYETLRRVFWFLNIWQRDDKWSSHKSIFCPLCRGFSAWCRSGRAGSATLKARPVTALLVLGHVMKPSGMGNSQLNSADFLLPTPAHSVEIWGRVLNFTSSGVLREGNSRILEGWVCYSHVGICLLLFPVNKLSIYASIACDLSLSKSLVWGPQGGIFKVFFCGSPRWKRMFPFSVCT